MFILIFLKVCVKIDFKLGSQVNSSAFLRASPRGGRRESHWLFAAIYCQTHKQKSKTSFYNTAGKKGAQILII